MTGNYTIFSFPDYAQLAEDVARLLSGVYSQVETHQFPDQESCVRIHPVDVTPTCIVINSLYHPDELSLPLIFLAETLREYGAERVILVAPYLSYMRQDTRFQEGEGITAKYYSNLISSYFDDLITVDPHLHRIHKLNEIYTIPTHTIHAAPLVANWIHNNIERPLLIGPDSESEQWVKDLAGLMRIPYLILEKTRHGDRDVEVSIPETERWSEYETILYDDIISTGRTMIETIKHLNNAGMSPPVCIGIHGVFAGTAYDDLISAGAKKIITSNSIPHQSNTLDLSSIIGAKLLEIVN
jgi:ribose-phosphate pyrophosphokinase